MWEAKYPGWLLGSTMGDYLIAIPFTGTRKLQEKKQKNRRWQSLFILCWDYDTWGAYLSGYA